MQLFGFTQDVKVYVFLKTSMALDHVVLAQEVLTLTTGNSHQDIAKVQVRHGPHNWWISNPPEGRSRPDVTSVSVSSCFLIDWIRP